jgi:hypothetical protein
VPERAPGIVGVIAQDTARYSMFAASLTGLDLPEGTEVIWRFGHQISAQTNQLVEALMATDKEWLWIMGDDHSFSHGLLTKLLDHELPTGHPEIIVPLCLTKVPPYSPVVFTGFEADGRHRQRISLGDYPEGGLVAIHSAGSAGMLIRRTVFEKIEPPWFTSYDVSPVEMGEDVGFCDKARDAGFQVWCDLDASLGHCVSGVVWPVRERDGWTYGFSLMGGYTIRMPHRL